jgi:hypothetical protein
MSSSFHIHEASIAVYVCLILCTLLAMRNALMLLYHKQKGSQPRNRENEQLIEDLYKRNTELQRENGELKSKNKSLIEALAKEKKKVSAVCNAHYSNAHCSDADCSDASCSNDYSVHLQCIAVCVCNGRGSAGRMLSEVARSTAKGLLLARISCSVALAAYLPYSMKAKLRL